MSVYIWILLILWFILQLALKYALQRVGLWSSSTYMKELTPGAFKEVKEYVSVNLHVNIQYNWNPMTQSSSREGPVTIVRYLFYSIKDQQYYHDDATLRRNIQHKLQDKRAKRNKSCSGPSASSSGTSSSRNLSSFEGEHLDSSTPNESASLTAASSDVSTQYGPYFCEGNSRFRIDTECMQKML